MPQTHTISRNNTTVEKDSEGRVTAVTLHSTTILRIDWEARKITVNTGGWHTVTTQTRLNQAFTQLKLPFRVGRSKGTMSIYRLVDGVNTGKPERELGYKPEEFTL